MFNKHIQTLYDPELLDDCTMIYIYNEILKTKQHSYTLFDLTCVLFFPVLIFNTTHVHRYMHIQMVLVFHSQDF